MDTTITTTTKGTNTITAAKAEALWADLNDALANVEKTIIKIIEQRAWEPLGYASFMEAWSARLDGTRLNTEALRCHVVYAMFDSGATDKEVISATRVGDQAVARLREQRVAGIPPAAATTRVTKPRRASSTVSFGLDPAEYAEYAAVCEAHGVNLADVALRALRAQMFMLKGDER